MQRKTTTATFFTLAKRYWKEKHSSDAVFEGGTEWRRLLRESQFITKKNAKTKLYTESRTKCYWAGVWLSNGFSVVITFFFFLIS